MFNLPTHLVNIDKYVFITYIIYIPTYIPTKLNVYIYNWKQSLK
jgi:hypothetical protein